jgi:hypothetical protein
MQSQIALRRLLPVATLLVLLPLVSPAGPAGEADRTNQLAQVKDFELTDQLGQLHRLHFPRTNLTLLVLADREGAAQIDSWIAPLRQRYTNQVKLAGIADVSAAPAWMSNSLVRRFQREQREPVMLDWSGAVSRQLAPRKGKANLYLLNQQGQLIRRWAGASDRAGTQEVFDAIDRVNR